MYLVPVWKKNWLEGRQEVDCSSFFRLGALDMKLGVFFSEKIFLSYYISIRNVLFGLLGKWLILSISTSINWHVVSSALRILYSFIELMHMIKEKNKKKNMKNLTLSSFQIIKNMIWLHTVSICFINNIAVYKSIFWLTVFIFVHIYQLLNSFL